MTVFQYCSKKNREDKMHAKQLVRELSKKKPNEEARPWKDAKTGTCEFETHIKRLKAGILTNAAYFRIHLCPRSYDEKVYEPHKVGFKYPTLASQNFPEPTIEMQTKEGRDRLTRNIANYEAHVTMRKAEEDHYLANKRVIIAEQSHPRWAPTQSHGQMFGEPFCDPNYLFKKDLSAATYTGL
jgi:hypothetical protein